MPWRCPACSTSIRPQLTAAGREKPEPTRVYRCAVCQLPLVLSDDGTQMIVAPLNTQDAPLKNSEPW